MQQAEAGPKFTFICLGMLSGPSGRAGGLEEIKIAPFSHRVADENCHLGVQNRSATKNDVFCKASVGD